MPDHALSMKLYVRTIDGRSSVHEYQFSGSGEQIARQMENVVMAFVKMMRGEQPTFIASNPPTIYKGDHVVSIKTESSDTTAEQALETLLNMPIADQQE